jgi:hypothetical protein
LSRRACPARHGSSIRFRIEAPQVSWLGESLRSLSRCRKSNRSCGAAFPLRPESRDSELRTVARAENFRLTVARRRRLLTVFPCAESLVIVDGARNHSAPLAKANDHLRDTKKFSGSHDDAFLVVDFSPFRSVILSAAKDLSFRDGCACANGSPAKSPAVVPSLAAPPRAALQTLPPANRVDTPAQASRSAKACPFAATRSDQRTPRPDSIHA